MTASSTMRLSTAARHTISRRSSSTLVLGGHRWTQAENYPAIVQTAFSQGVTHFQAGQDGGAEALRQALEGTQGTTAIVRWGYRTQVTELAGDVVVDETEEHKVVHNLNVQAAAETCPLVAAENVQVMATLHNPEVSRNKLSEGLQSMQELVKQGSIQGFGLTSNGLCLPSDHPLHLSWVETVLPAMEDAMSKVGELDLKLVELPVNLLETKGLEVAKEIKESLPHVEIHAQRPLTCYPDLGTGSGHPFILADYLLPATMEKQLTWSHQMETTPQVYEVALKAAMAHFDATELLELKEQGDLTTDQRETLDGCKLLQSLLHDVDLGLENLRSFRAHETDLYEQVIPLIHDTFESYDEDTAKILQSFFAAYSMAVRYAIARNTRKLLVEGENGANPMYPELPPDMRLQEFALRWLLEDPSIDKITIGCSKMDQVMEDLEIIEAYEAEHPN